MSLFLQGIGFNYVIKLFSLWYLKANLIALLWHPCYLHLYNTEIEGLTPQEMLNIFMTIKTKDFWLL